MLRLINVMLVLAVLAGGFVLYSLEHRTRQTERAIVATDQKIKEEREHSRLLEAEWSLLTRPQRLEQLARTHLNMGPVMPDQIVSMGDIANHIPEAPVTEPDNTPADEDPLAELLRIMQ